MSSPRNWRHLLAVAGPGVVAMLADTDVGSLVTAAQSGAKWGYSLVFLQILLVPVLYIVQELTGRLGASTGKGHGELIREHFGPIWAWISFGGLVLAGLGAIATEFSGLAGVGDIFGLSRWISLGLPMGILMLVVATGSYKRVERFAILVGLFELVFLWLAWKAQPSPRDILGSLAHAPITQGGYLTLVAANIGAVIMPWMIFYQQSAVADKGLKIEDRRGMRWDTLAGAVVSQAVMSALLLAAAASLHHGNADGLETVGDLAKAFTPALGAGAGQVVLGIGIVAAAFVSLNVVSLALAWSLGDMTGVKHTLHASPAEAPVFYGVYAAVVILGAVLVEVVHDLVALNIAVEVMNALLLPLALGLLVMLARRALPPEHRIDGAYRWLVYGVAGVTIGAGVIGGIAELVR